MNPSFEQLISPTFSLFISLSFFLLIADIPVFSGFINEDPREYLVTFKCRCVSLNYLIEDRWLMILPIFLDDSAKVWYERQTDAVRQNWLRLTSAMFEYFGKGEEPIASLTGVCWFNLFLSSLGIKLYFRD